MEYGGTTGAWLKVDDSLDGKAVKLITECIKVESRFKDEKTGEAKTENQVKARFQGAEESVNMRLNWTTVYALVEAFGRDSKDWIGHVLTAKVKDATTGQSIYLVPEGFELVRGDDKRWTIKRAGPAHPAAAAITASAEEQADAIEGEMLPPEEEEINPEDIPF